METIQMERLNGGRGECRAGSTVTPKVQTTAEPWRELTVEKIVDHSLSGDSRITVEYKKPDGKFGKISAEHLLLTTSSELQALAQLESIREMVAALKKAEAKAEREVSKRNSYSGVGAADTDAERTREAIRQDPLSVEVRGPWEIVGNYSDPDNRGKAAEFKILLCTGGPAVQIIGELNAGEPENPRLQHQDWGTPWTDVRLSAEDEETLLAYCREFYFGE